MLGDKMAVTVLPAMDIERAKNFYVNKLGLSLDSEMPGGVMLIAGEDTRILLYDKPEGTKAEHTVLGFSVPDLEMEMSELKEKGIRFEDYDIPEMGLETKDGMAEMDGIKSAWFKDSEGNIVNIVQM